MFTQLYYFTDPVQSIHLDVHEQWVLDQLTERHHVLR